MILNEPIRIVYSLGHDGLSSICRNIIISDIGLRQQLYKNYILLLPSPIFCY